MAATGRGETRETRPKSDRIHIPGGIRQSVTDHRANEAPEVGTCKGGEGCGARVNGGCATRELGCETDDASIGWATVPIESRLILLDAHRISALIRDKDR